MVMSFWVFFFFFGLLICLITGSQPKAQRGRRKVISSSSAHTRVDTGRLTSCSDQHTCPSPCRHDDHSSHLASRLILFTLTAAQSLSRVRLLVTRWTAARQASLSFTVSLSLLRLLSTESVMSSSRLILCGPPLPPLALSLPWHPKLILLLPVYTFTKRIGARRLDLSTHKMP